MKSIISLTLFLTVLNHTWAESKKTETVTIKTRIYCDHCLVCNSCGSNIYDAIRKAEGIKYTSIDPEAHTITVTLSQITFPYILFISLVSLLGGILNSICSCRRLIEMKRISPNGQVIAKPGDSPITIGLIV